MNKDTFYSYKPWLVFTLLVFAMVMFSFSTVRAADLLLESNEVEVWTSSGYKAVTVGDSSMGSSLTAAPQEECILNETGMVSHWPLDEQSGATTFFDLVGSNNGTCEGETCPTRTFGKVGGAFNFNANFPDPDAISVPAKSGSAKTTYDAMANGSFSLAVWVKTTQTCSESEVLKNKVFLGRYRELSANGTWWIGCTEPGGVAVFRLRDSTNAVRQVNGTKNITDGKWHFIVGVRDASADKNYLYVDGQLENMLEAPPYFGNFSSDMDITMGGYDEPENYYLNGSLDEAVLYNRAIPGNEINSYYGSCKTATTITYLPIALR